MGNAMEKVTQVAEKIQKVYDVCTPRRTVFKKWMLHLLKKVAKFALKPGDSDYVAGTHLRLKICTTDVEKGTLQEVVQTRKLRPM